MNTFYICRHGQTENNKTKTFSGWIDTPLTEQGVRDARSTAAKLAGATFDVIIASDLGRAFITAYIISRRLGYTAEIIRSNKLREVSYGDMGGVSIEKAQRVYSGLDKDTNCLPPNGESLGQMQQRVLECIAAINSQYKNKTVLLVTHGMVINAVKASFLQEDLGYHIATEGIDSHDYVATFEMEGTKITQYQEVA